MARTTVVKSARKAQGNCQSPECKHESREIPVGSSYKWFSIRSHKGGRGTRKVYHVDCFVPQSHRTTSQHLATIYDAIETAEREMGALGSDSTADDFRSIAEQAAEGVREAAESYRESAQNIEDGFGHSTYVSDELNEKADNVESWADEIESVEFEDFSEEDARSEAEGEIEDDEFDSDEDREAEIESRIESAREKWYSEAESALQDALDNNPL